MILTTLLTNVCTTAANEGDNLWLISVVGCPIDDIFGPRCLFRIAHSLIIKVQHSQDIAVHFKLLTLSLYLVRPDNFQQH